MPQQQSSGGRWFPTIEQLKDPEATERAFRQVLTQLYALTDQFNAMRNDRTPKTLATTPPPGSGPADSMLVGLHVAPIDTSTLTNGATLKFNKANGNLEFS